MSEEADGRLVARCCEGDRKAFADLRAAGTRAISLSLDAAGAAAHDGFRGVDGGTR